jgi:hypothetical protein
MREKMQEKRMTNWKPKIANILLYFILVLPNCFFLIFTSLAKEVVEITLLGDVIRIDSICRMFGRKIVVFTYVNGISLAIERIGFDTFGLNSPMVAYVFILIGFIIGVFYGMFNLDMWENQKELRKKSSRREKITERVMVSVGLIANILGITGMFLYRAFIFELRAFYPDMKLNFPYYYLMVAFFIALLVTGFRSLFPPEELRIKSKKELEAFSQAVSKKSIIESPTYKTPIASDSNLATEELMFEKIKKLIEECSGTISISWLEKVTHYSKEAIEEIIIQELELEIIDGRIIKKGNNETSG